MPPQDALRYGAAAVLWLIVIGRFIAAQRRGAGQDRQIRFFWGIFFCLTLAATAYLPAVEQIWIAAGAGWIGPLPRTALALTGYLLGIHLGHEFAPALQPRWNWPRLLVALTLAALTLLAWAAGHGALPPAGVALDALFNYTILLLVVRQAYPAFAWARWHERQRPMRLRFSVMLVMQTAIGAWMLVGIVEALLIVLGRPLDFSGLYSFLLITCTASFILAHMMPARYFVTLVRWADHAQDLAAFGWVRLLEGRVAALTGRRLTLVTVSEVVRTPGRALYQSVIAIFDARKLLRSHRTLPAQILAAQMEPATRPQLTYEEVVQELAGLGRHEARKQIARQIRLALPASLSRGDA